MNRVMLGTSVCIVVCCFCVCVVVILFLCHKFTHKLLRTADMVGCGEIGHVRTGQKKHRNFTSRNMFNVVVNRLHGLHRLKGSHRMRDKRKSVKSAKSVDNKNDALRQPSGSSGSSGDKNKNIK